MTDDVETIVIGESFTRRAPVELIGRVVWANGLYVSGDVLPVAGDELLARPLLAMGTPFRTGRAVVLANEQGAPFVNLSTIVAICAGDYVYRIGKPFTPSLEERVAALERRAYPDLIIADDAEASGRPEVAEKLRARHRRRLEP